MIHIDESTVVLGIETSCDETAAAVVMGGNDVLSSVVATQIEQHARFGGVVPEIASRAHVEAMTPVVRKAMSDAGVAFERIDAVAATVGPGLVGALLVGVAAAKSIALVLDKANTPLLARPSTTLPAKRSTKLLAFSTSVIRVARQSIALRARAMQQRLIFRAPCCTTGSMFRSAVSKQAWSITFVKILLLPRPTSRRRFKLQWWMCWWQRQPKPLATLAQKRSRLVAVLRQTRCCEHR